MHAAVGDGCADCAAAPVEVRTYPMRCGQVEGYERKVVLFSDQILVAKTLPREYLLLEHLVKLKGTA